ncbi:hypothetical protein D9M68_810880 [compost metagenome]
MLTFGRILVLDATLPDDYQLPFPHVGFFKAGCTLKARPDEYEVYGPSRLEIDLMANSYEYLTGQLAGFSRVVKLSAGYRVNNLYRILARVNEGVLFRFGNPFRVQVKFCLSSFYVLPCAALLRFVQYAHESLPQVSKTNPLEAVLYNFLKTLNSSPVSIVYPDIQAVFLSDGTHSDQFSFKCKLYIYGILSRMGLYAKVVRHG